MTYILPNLEYAAARTANLNAREPKPARFRFLTQRYPDGTPNREAWPWGVGRYELNYGKNGEERFDGFVWF